MGMCSRVAAVLWLLGEWMWEDQLLSFLTCSSPPRALLRNQCLHHSNLNRPNPARIMCLLCMHDGSLHVNTIFLVCLFLHKLNRWKPQLIILYQIGPFLKRLCTPYGQWRSPQINAICCIVGYSYSSFCICFCVNWMYRSLTQSLPLLKSTLSAV